MPCTDVTEILKLRIDSADRLVTYSLTKRTCGGALGKESLLLKWCGGLPARDILKTTVDQFLDRYATDDPVVEFVRLLGRPVTGSAGLTPFGRSSVSRISDSQIEILSQAIDSLPDIGGAVEGGLGNCRVPPTPPGRRTGRRWPGR